MGGCYTNAWAMARKNPELAYCEGVAMAADLPIPLSHAWCLHIPTMTVIETTWEAGEGTAYLGLVFPDKTVKEALRLSKPAGIVSILDGDWARRGWFHQRDNAQTAISRTCELTGDPLEGIQAEANKAGEPASGKGAKQRKRKGAAPEAEQSRGASIT